MVDLILANPPTDGEINKLITKRRAQSTFEKLDFFQFGSEHMGTILPLIKQTLLTVPGIVMPEDEEDLHEQIEQVFNDQTIDSLDKYCTARVCLDKKISASLQIPDAKLRRSHLYSPDEETKVIEKPDQGKSSEGS